MERIKTSKCGDIHTARRKWARLHHRGCSKQCPCEWCTGNRTFKNKRQEPIDDNGRILR